MVGNPPYQENNDDRNRDDAIYPYFYDLAEKIGIKYCLITPARFLFGVGATNENWNQKMLKDKSIKVGYFNQTSSEVFKNTDIKGGVVALYRDSSADFGAIEIFTAHEKLNSILNKVVESGALKNSFGELMHVQTKYNLNALYNNNPKFKERLGSNGKEKRLVSSTFDTLAELYSDKKLKENQVQVFGRHNNNRVFKWIDKEYLEVNGNFERYKVFVPAANGSGAIGEVLSTPIIGMPNIGHTQTFISIGSFTTKNEAESLLKYLKGKFSRAMLGIKKITQNNKTKETWSTTPVQDFTSNSDIDWSKSVPEIDQQLYKKYGLDQSEIDFIESKVKAMI